MGIEQSQSTLLDYETSLAANAQATGQAAARRGDPDGFDHVLDAIRDAAASGSEFTADDCRISARDNQVGAAFKYLAARGEIRAVGFVVSRRQAAHGRRVTSWRRST